MPELPLDRLDAVVFDTDGVLTDTARVHAAAWAAVRRLPGAAGGVPR